MYKILKAETLAAKIHLMVVHAPRVASHCQPGQFIIVKLDEKGERMDQLAQRNLGEKVLIPCNMLRSGEDVFLDDLTVEDVRQALKTEVVVVDEPGADLVNCLIEVPDHKKIRRRQIYEQTGSSDSGQT